MAKIFITGSADGLGQLAAKELTRLGHQVVLHARNAERGKYALGQVPSAEDVLIADLSSMNETKALASKANALGTFDAVIHNAGVYQVPRNSVTVDGLSLTFAVNSLAPYILTCLMHKPKRLIYLSSGMHRSGNPELDNLLAGSYVSYSDTKLHDVILAM
ncbi:MAG TPA: SDR family NAD(P)-dependent oxidoreductase, partial [Mucilaginibacter sp.]|nr:SDR family NAD(P)-dependent oxidoreductase [Mucilaginibacter sp.]